MGIDKHSKTLCYVDNVPNYDETLLALHKALWYMIPASHIHWKMAIF